MTQERVIDEKEFHLAQGRVCKNTEIAESMGAQIMANNPAWLTA